MPRVWTDSRGAELCDKRWVQPPVIIPVDVLGIVLEMRAYRLRTDPRTAWPLCKWLCTIIDAIFNISYIDVHMIMIRSHVAAPSC